MCDLWPLRCTAQLIKSEPLEITYSYWDGTGHRRKVVVKKGDSIGDFLKACRDQVRSPEQPEPLSIRGSRFWGEDTASQFPQKACRGQVYSSWRKSSEAQLGSSEIRDHVLRLRSERHLDQLPLKARPG